MARKLSWEIKFENMLGEEPVSEKIEAIKSEIEGLKASKVKGDFKSAEEYQIALKEHKKEIRKEVRKKENKIKEYNNFQNNKDKITNILEYRKDLEKRLKILVKNSKPTFNEKEILAKESEKKARRQRMAQLEREITKLEQNLKENLTDEEKLNYQVELQAKLILNNSLKEKQDKLVTEIKGLKETQKQKTMDKETERKKLLYERRISKCNLIASNLLKGKDLGEIIPTTEKKEKKLVSKEDKLKKQIKATKEAAKQVASQQGIREGNSSINNYEELLENKKKEEKIKKNVKKQAKTEKTELIELTEFEKEHPKLAKVLNIFKKIRNKFRKNKERLPEENKPESKSDNDKTKQQTRNTKNKNTNQPKISKHEEEMENKLLLDIVENGREDAFRKRMKVNTTKAANDYAKHYGGRYEKQDGATAKYKDNKKTSRGNNEREKED